MYEGLFIFPEMLEDEQLDQAIDAVKTEIEKLGGSLESSTRLGKRSFARPMRKKKAGIYVFRAQFMKKEETEAALEA
jgi:ribosomal protein S6